MTRLNIVLLLAVLASALYLVSVQYESRRLFTELDRANAESHRLELENERLQVEKRAQATPAASGLCRATCATTAAKAWLGVTIRTRSAACKAASRLSVTISAGGNAASGR